MKINKQTEYPKETVAVAYIAKILGHPARISLLKILAAHDACTCGQLVNELPLSQAMVSKHLTELRRSRLIIGVKKETCSYYSIDWKTFGLLEKTFEFFFSDIRKLKQDNQTTANGHVTK